MPMNARAFRFEVVEDFLKADIPIYNVEKLRPQTIFSAP